MKRQNRPVTSASKKQVSSKRVRNVREVMVSIPNQVRKLLDRRGLRHLLVPMVRYRARSGGNQVRDVFYDEGLWIHDTSHGYFANHEPLVRLDMALIDKLARVHFFWGYTPKPGDVILDIGAGVGEEALTFSREVGNSGRVICVEAHPTTYRCLEKLVAYNHLRNVNALHKAVAQPSVPTVTIEDSGDYLANRSGLATGISVGAMTVDSIRQTFGLGRINFLKMNIEGAERFAIQGMEETLQNTEILCVSCHDFLAKTEHDDSYRTKEVVKEFLSRKSFRIADRTEKGLPPYLIDQVWAYNEALQEGVAAHART